MKVAYIRVSSIDQNEQRQITEMKKFGAEKIFIEKQSGATITQRPIFQEALDFVREQDIFIVEAIDRLGRNYDEIIDSVNYLKKKNVQLIITSLPIMAEAIGNPLLDKFIKDLIIQILAMIAEQERTESKRRQAQGIKIANGMATVFLTNFIRCRTSFRMLFRLSLTMSLLGCDDLRQELTIKVRLPR
ncbi:recombinase family protein [Enterococcus spodopteracolus]|uniref:recombinase family protein n=1 Tax=Enterococcus spodopteracolus TaxID=3034501 RepID=UPI0029621F7A|nr:recombinase family protein [Enterococcus spodopteracolus]